MSGKVSKKSTIIILILFSLCLIQSFSVLADEIKEIRSLYVNINKLIREGKTQEFLFYLTSSGWKKIEVIKDLNSRNEVDLNEHAKVYIYQNKLIKAVIIISTPSGDWQNTAEYYFYENGKTAFIFESHLTFHGYNFEKDENLPPGPYVIEKRIYFSKDGKKIRSLVKSFVKSTKEEVPIKFLRQIEFEIYPDIKSLPFRSLLK